MFNLEIIFFVLEEIKYQSVSAMSNKVRFMYIGDSMLPELRPVRLLCIAGFNERPFQSCVLWDRTLYPNAAKFAQRLQRYAYHEN